MTSVPAGTGSACGSASSLRQRGLGKPLRRGPPCLHGASLKTNQTCGSWTSKTLVARRTAPAPLCRPLRTGLRPASPSGLSSQQQRRKLRCSFKLSKLKQKAALPRQFITSSFPPVTSLVVLLCFASIPLYYSMEKCAKARRCCLIALYINSKPPGGVLKVTKQAYLLFIQPNALFI